jgi:biopolymer transport protein TolR
MSMAVGGPGGGAKADINVTPLIDVLLVLLIIFMVITPLTPHGLDALAPQPPEKNKPQQPEDQRTVVIEVAKGGPSGPVLTVNTQPIAENALQQRLIDIFKTRAERLVFVKGDPDLEYGEIAKVIDIAKGAQIDKVGLMTPRLEAGQ